MRKQTQTQYIICYHLTWFGEVNHDVAKQLSVNFALEDAGKLTISDRDRCAIRKCLACFQNAMKGGQVKVDFPAEQCKSERI